MRPHERDIESLDLRIVDLQNFMRQVLADLNFYREHVEKLSERVKNLEDNLGDLYAEHDALHRAVISIEETMR